VNPLTAAAAHERYSPDFPAKLRPQGTWPRGSP